MFGSVQYLMGHTCLPAYSDSVGTVKQCHCKQGPSYSDTFYIKNGLGIAKTVNVTGGVTLTGVTVIITVTVSGEACMTVLDICECVFITDGHI